MKNLNAVFSKLKSIMLPYSKKLDCKTDTNDELYIDTSHIQKNKKPLWFGGVQIKKNYVSYHLMPVYLNPQLLDSISPELKKRMQGKSCFNFTETDESLFKELAELTQKSYEDYKKQGFV